MFNCISHLFSNKKTNKKTNNYYKVENYYKLTEFMLTTYFNLYIFCKNPHNKAFDIIKESYVKKLNTSYLSFLCDNINDIHKCVSCIYASLCFCEG